MWMNYLFTMTLVTLAYMQERGKDWLVSYYAATAFLHCEDTPVNERCFVIALLPPPLWSATLCWSHTAVLCRIWGEKAHSGFMLCSSTTVHHCIILYMTTEQLHSHENLMLAKERCTVESLSCTGGWCMYVWIFNWTCVWLYVWTSTSPTVRPLDIGENTAVHTFHYLVYHTAPIFVLFVKYQVFVWLAVET